mmetsp:Transcript_12323/g.14741  ORF Transcript_12323/g.14741 Transcript_12323/m.14741 type:complete len:213 (+) Transcript_12323:266-904(+)
MKIQLKCSERKYVVPSCNPGEIDKQENRSLSEPRKRLKTKDGVAHVKRETPQYPTTDRWGAVKHENSVSSGGPSTALILRKNTGIIATSSSAQGVNQIFDTGVSTRCTSKRGKGSRPGKQSSKSNKMPVESSSPLPTSSDSLDEPLLIVPQRIAYLRKLLLLFEKVSVASLSPSKKNTFPPTAESEDERKKYKHRVQYAVWGLNTITNVMSR